MRESPHAYGVTDRDRTGIQKDHANTSGFPTSGASPDWPRRRPKASPGLVRGRAPVGVEHPGVSRAAGSRGGPAASPVLVYKSIRGVTRLVGSGVDAALARAGEPSVRFANDDTTSKHPEREAVLAALNGVMGDRLLADNNPFAIPMTLRSWGQVMDLNNPPPVPEATGKILVLIHGLCMNDLQWRTNQVRPRCRPR